MLKLKGWGAGVFCAVFDWLPKQSRKITVFTLFVGLKTRAALPLFLRLVALKV